MIDIRDVPNTELISETGFPGVGDLIYIATSRGDVYRIALVLEVLPQGTNTLYFDVLYIKQFIDDPSTAWLENKQARMAIHTMVNLNYWYIQHP